MDTAHARPGRQAWRELLPLLWPPGFLGAVGLIQAVNLSLGLPWPQDQHGHLLWPLVQWALTTPAGALASIAAGTAILALILLPGWRVLMRMAYRNRLAYAVDMTDVPREAWPMHPIQRRRPVETLRERWLGHGRRAQRTNLALLVLGLLLALMFLAGFLATIAFPTTALYRMAFIRICELHGCPPLYPAGLITAVIVQLQLPLVLVAAFGWPLYVEARCGIEQLEYMSRRPAQMGYVRRPGVTPEAAAAALARFIPRHGAPLARVFVVTMLAVTPIVLLALAGLFLNSWLRLQWIPG